MISRQLQTSQEAFEIIASEFGVLRRGNHCLCRCVAHDDKNPSLSVSLRDGRLLVHCFSGCSQSEVVGALKEQGFWPDVRTRPSFKKSISMSQRSVEASRKSAWTIEAPTYAAAARVFLRRVLRSGFVHEATYRYVSEQCVFFKARARNPKTGEKTFIFFHESQPNRFTNSKPEFQRCKGPLYLNERIRLFPLSEIIIVCEGEGCADALRRLGICAVTSGGASSARCCDWSKLKGRKIIVWPDYDTPGIQYAREVTEHLLALRASVSWVNVSLLRLSKGGDCVDFVKWHPNITREDVLNLPRLLPCISGGHAL